MTRSSAGVLSGTPTVVIAFGFIITATDANGCTGTRSYTINISGNPGPMFYPLAHPVRLLETRFGATGCYQPNAALFANQIYVQPARGACGGVTIPANALGIVGNATVVLPLGNGYLTLWPSDEAQVFVASSNFAAGAIFNRHFTVGLGNGDGAFKILSSAMTDLVIDVSGYFAP